VVKDFNGDGHPDVFAAGFRHVDLGTSGYGSMSPNLKLGDSWGDFGGKQQIMSDSSKADGPIGAAAGDLNSDGYPDAVTLNLNSNTISVMLNETASNAVVSDATTITTAAPEAGTETATTPATTARAAAARSGGARTVPVTITCRRGLGGIGCRGTLIVRRLKGAAKTAQRAGHDASHNARIVTVRGA
jgi:hypothetical protein